MKRTEQEDDESWLGQEIALSEFRDARLRKRFGLLLERLWKGMGLNRSGFVGDRRVWRYAARAASARFRL
ncbi:transposase DNA-binding-containing protein [Burkholderia pyrrocinia]|uniref:transposase DNA-binding-containing protein n=1 Tax=Burkholderia pyrrocinia TaxID=60550 RepID=UPI00158E9981|nr:transposase DNA-binding-containing protein [Burkholderia pyrrocinia]